MTAAFALLTTGGIVIGLLPIRYALAVGVAAVVGLSWWVWESATGAFAEGSVRGDLTLLVAFWLAIAIAVGMGSRAVVCNYRSRRRVT